MVANEYKGKNACTAWVNFDGTTTPPTIRDSFNVSDVVRTDTGRFDVYFESNMNTTNYCQIGMVGVDSSLDMVNMETRAQSLDKLSIAIKRNFDDYEDYRNASITTISIFGGKN
jgi:hypothetical protein